MPATLRDVRNDPDGADKEWMGYEAWQMLSMGSCIPRVMLARRSGKQMGFTPEARREAKCAQHHAMSATTVAVGPFPRALFTPEKVEEDRITHCFPFLHMGSAIIEVA